MKLKTLVCSALLLLVFFALYACAAPAPTPTQVAVQPTTTAIPSTATNTPVPATATATQVPPTATHTASSTPTRTLTATFTRTATRTATATQTATSSPTATFTAVPPTATRVPPTATLLPPTVKPTLAPTRPPTAAPAAKAFSVTWNTNMSYEGRTADSFWCQFHNQYQNNTAQEMPFQEFKDQSDGRVILLSFDPTLVTGGFQPIIGIANADGTINRWVLAGWYAKIFGWSNGIEEFPPRPLGANAPSGDWTWYNVSRPGEFCKFAYVKWKGQISAAEYAPDGKLVNTNATLPPGAP